MLITLECILLALQAVAAVRLALHSPIGTTSQSSNRLSKRSPVQLGSDIGQCFTMKVNVNGVGLSLRVDSDISDIIIPLPSSSNDVGLTPESISNGQPVTIKYKYSDYYGVIPTVAVTIPGTRITDTSLPILAVKKLSADSVGIGGTLKQGIFGFGYTSLSNHHSKTTAMDILYNNDVIPNNEVSLQLCPYDMTSESFINIGNTDVAAKCGTNGKSIAWVESPSDDRHTVNIKSVLVNDKQVDLPEEFQKRMENGRILYSTVETCFLYMSFPETIVKALVDAIADSDAITVKYNVYRIDFLNRQDFNDIFWRHHLMPEAIMFIKWNKLPTLTITMFAETPVTDENRDSIVTIKLGPRDYIQKVDFKNLVFAVKADSNDHAVLGASFMSRLGLTFDRQNARIGFGPGCGCEVLTDGYPIISDHYRVLWSPSQLPEQPSTSGSSGTFIRRRKPTTTTDQVVLPENTHHTVKSHTTTHDKLD
ncbi:hypothetical protein QVD99_002039 [Batrachochytrium dendrobatidis]|nr:hypothetical protein O5D80_000681 [Batrachochytrium dendrobatidis]KAK5672240.1 hypothetical protein QVD99_002039 [Batrachochytrium dendrobatidis]